ncbi:MAG: non-ribosomal peptide synthetase, partial [Betaproteobacteria bacterium]|nr:non-ribosomal peptide synthetase [Betaproteobacteria bacterium]
LRLTILGGERLAAQAVQQWRELRLPGVRVLNAYGPTECTITATLGEAGEEQGPITIGRPLPGRAVYILDRGGRLAPTGVPGELYIGGSLLARGYLNQPGLTKERFVPDPFGGAEARRLYRTGDVARFLPDGRIDFLGRTDDQVKIRGYRIELGEIEAALREQAGVATCVLTTYAPTLEDVRLVAYLVAKPGAAPNPADLRQALRARLPDYMVPQHLVPLDALPLLPNGKLDRAALPAPQAAAPTAHTRQAARLPSTPQEQQIAAIWRELLGVERVQLTDNFFDLGGHSLLAMRAVIAIEQQLGWRIAPRRLIFESLGQLARPSAAEPHTV